MCMCCHVYIYGIYELPGAVGQTQSCQIYGPLRGHRGAGLMFGLALGHRAARAVSLPVSSHVEETFISVEATGLHHDDAAEKI